MKKITYIILVLFCSLLIENVNADTLCKRATTLHTEECSQTSGYCYSEGYYIGGKKNTSTITYGNIGNKGIIKSGDAFDCDVDGDGSYSSIYERFYVVTTDDDYVVMIASTNSYTNLGKCYGTICYGNLVNSNAITYNDNSSSSTAAHYGPTSAIEYLPTIETYMWPNVSLRNNTRTITDEKGKTILNFKYEYAISSPTNINNTAARFLTYQEANQACNNMLQSDGGKSTAAIANNCEFLLENTTYAHNDTSKYLNGYWLETPSSTDSTKAWYLSSSSKSLDTSLPVYVSSNGVRPVIEVTKDRIEGSQEVDTEIKSNNDNIYILGKMSDLYQKKFEVNEYLKDSNTYKKLQETFSNKKNIIAYSFNLYDASNNLVEPESKVTVNIKLPTNMNYDKIRLWYVTEEFNKQELEYSIHDNVLSFETDHFSTYVLTEDQDEEIVNVADTAFNLTKIGITIGLIVLVLGIMVIVQTLLKDKKKSIVKGENK